MHCGDQWAARQGGRRLAGGSWPLAPSSHVPGDPEASSRLSTAGRMFDFGSLEPVGSEAKQKTTASQKQSGRGDPQVSFLTVRGPDC